VSALPYSVRRVVCVFAPRTESRERPGCDGSWKDDVGMSAAIACVAGDAETVGREGSCERILRDLLIA
jgi:hypothetical protein